MYVFTRSGATWSQQAYIKASNTGSGDRFGQAIALSGDTLAVGAFDESSNATGIGGNGSDNSASGSGAAYVFTRNAGVWTEQAYIKASNTEAGDNFGHQVALSGNTLAVSSIYEDSNATGLNGDQTNNSAAGSGAVYVFTRNGTTWAQQTYLKASNSDAGDGFGWALTLSGQELLVGAPVEASNATGVGGDETNNSAIDSGAAYLFQVP